MIWLWIIAAVAALILLVLFSNVRIYIIYDKDLYSYYRVFWFIKEPLYPEKGPEKYISAKRIKKRRKKLHKKRTKRLNDKKDTIGEVFTDVKDMVKELLELIYIILKKFLGRVRIRVRKLDITVASDDAASTALTYALVCDSLNVLIDMLSNTDRINCKFGKLDCRCDYTDTQFTAEVDILIKVRIIQVIRVLFDSMMEQIKSTI